LPELDKQAEMEGVETAVVTVVRALLAKALAHEKAVEAIEPYRETVEFNPAAREAMAEVAGRARMRKTPAFLFVNNRLEGHAPSTIEAMVDAVG
jgi:hypothetical protein